MMKVCQEEASSSSHVAISHSYVSVGGICDARTLPSRVLNKITRTALFCKVLSTLVVSCFNEQRVRKRNDVYIVYL